MASAPSIATLLAGLEAISHGHPDRVLRLRGVLPADPAADRPCSEPFELLIFRGFSSSTTHSTAFDPDQPALPEGSLITSAELLAGPLNPAGDVVPLVSGAVETFLRPDHW